MSPKKTILFTIPTLGAGGAERVMVTLLNHWAQKKEWNLVLLLHDSPEEKPFYTLDTSVDVHHTGCWKKGTKWKAIGRVRHMIQTLHPDLVVSFMAPNNILTLLGGRGLDVPVLISERIALEYWDLGALSQRVRDWIYNKACHIVVQTQRIKDSLAPSLQEKASVIPNPIAISKEKAIKKKRIIGVGRLHTQKGFDLLIKAFAKVYESYPEWELVIYGEGPEREDLESLVSQLNVPVFLPGRTQEIAREMAQSEIFVLSSRSEGMPNVLCEAMGLGLPVISTDCPTGPRELIQEGVNGLLIPVDHEDALASAMKALIEDQGLRQNLGQAAQASVSSFKIEAIASQWESLFKQYMR